MRLFPSIFYVPKHANQAPKKHKKTLIFAVVCVVVCLACVAGTTFAFFNVAKSFNTNGIEIEFPVEEAVTMKVKFQYTDKFLYRVGNASDVALGSLFEHDDTKTDETVDSSKISLVIDPIEGNSNGTFVKNETDWKQAKVRFNGTGVVKTTLKYGNHTVGTLNLEVVDGYNVTTYGELRNRNSVLLADIAITDKSQFFLSNATLYGNGFTFDVTNGRTEGKYVDSNYLVSLSNATLDNVQVVGAVYTQYGAMASSPYNNATVFSNGDSAIKNCYISNCASAVRVKGGNLTIENSTIKGGNFANLDIRNGHVTLENVTTINQKTENDLADNGSVVIGMGIVVYHEQVLDTTTLDIRGTLTQYNHVQRSDVNYIKDPVAKTLFNAMFNYPEALYENTWVSTGILSMTDKVGNDNITDVPGYIHLNPSMSGTTGYLHTPAPAAPGTAPQYSSMEQGSIPPSVTVNHKMNEVPKTEGSNRYCVLENGSVKISFDEGDNFEYDPSIMTVSKAGQNLDYTVTMGGVDYTGKKISFSETGNYTLAYNYTDPYNYKLDENGKLELYSETFEKTVEINVYAVKASAKHAEFTFGSNIASTTKVIGGNTYVMPVNGAGTVSVGGDTVNYIQVEMIPSDGKTDHEGGKWNGYYPVFDEVISITDYADGGTGNAITYNASTTALPAGLMVLDYSTDYKVSPPLDDSKWIKNQPPSKIFKYQAGSDAPNEPKAVNGKLYYSSPELSGVDRVEQNLYVKYKYTDNAGQNFYYYVCYHQAAQKKGVACFATGTLITLADGSQKPIEELTYNDKILAWDFFSGKYVESDIAILVYHGDDDYSIVNTEFSDGTTLKIVGYHDLFDYDLNQFINLTTENCTDYIGHRFVQHQSDGSYSLVTLTKAYVTVEHTGSYTIVSANNYNAIASGLLTLTPLDNNFFSWIEMSDKLQYDVDKFNADVEKYGLYDYDVFKDYLTYEQYVAFDCQYMKIPVEKGIFTFDYILELIETYSSWMPQQ